MNRKAGCTASDARRSVGIVLFALLFSACASVPREAVVLSNVVGERIAAIQGAHETLLTDYFRLSRERIEDFLQRRWIPVFLENFVVDADLMNLLLSVEPLDEEAMDRLTEELQRARLDEDLHQTVIAAVQNAFGDAERGQIVLEFAEAAIDQIQAQRRALVGPLEQAERRALSELRKSYAELLAAQGTVTAHLSSLRDVEEAQDAILQRLGLLERRDAVVSEAIALNERVMGVIDAGKSVAETLEELKGTVESGSSTSEER